MFNFLKKIWDKIFNRKIRKYSIQADIVLSFENDMKKLTDDELKQKTQYFKNEINKNNKTIDDIKFEAFAVVREAARRVLDQFPFKVQIIGALILNDGDIAEMKTGEGKTLTATMACYLNALPGKGVHVVTVNEYLVTRDANWMGQLYQFLGLSVGINLHDKTTEEKKQAFSCDITYSTNSELGFDYLRDNMVKNVNQKVMRGLNYVIVDEVDSILIDSSRTPLIISGGEKITEKQYIEVDNFVKSLKKDNDFSIDVKDRVCFLTIEGIEKAENFFNIKNIYDRDHINLVHCINQSLKANFIIMRDVEYIVNAKNQINLINQFTGRILKNVQYSDGLQQAIQAKEGLEIKPESKSLATITYQNFFRLYKKISGMTGTAKTEEEEFREIYNMKVTCVPTNKPVIRIDTKDCIFSNKKSKLDFFLKDVCERHKKGQPILIGTISVESSEEIAKLLDANHFKYEILNAKNHAREAEIISHAGEKGQITISTNMAGRGTDIKLGPGVSELGGLCVLGIERHESRRIDEQLRGRSGRQGDPGFSRFYVSFEDDLIKRFGNSRIIDYLKKLNIENLESSILSKVITNAQKQIEGINFDIRKNLLNYDNVLARQRKNIYEKRDQILYSENVKDIVNDFFYKASCAIVNRSISGDDNKVSIESLNNELKFILPNNKIKTSIFVDLLKDDAIDNLYHILFNFYLNKKNDVAKNNEIFMKKIDEIEKKVILNIFDDNWTKHIDNMSAFREGVYLRSYANVNPLQFYVKEGYQMFNQMFDNISILVVANILQGLLSIKKNEKRN